MGDFVGFLAAINLYIAYNFSQQIQVNFTLSGTAEPTIAFIILQIIFLSRYIAGKTEQ